MAALAKHPQVNADFLYDGFGDPLLPVTSGTLPVTTNILPGPPMAHTNLLTGDRHPISKVLDSETRYWLKLLPNNPIFGAKVFHVNPGDLLLMETARDQLDRNDIVSDHLCALRLANPVTDPNSEADPNTDPDDERVGYSLGHVFIRDGGLWVDLCGATAKRRAPPRKRRRKIRRKLDPEEFEQKKKSEEEEKKRLKKQRTFRLEPGDVIVGLALTLERLGDKLLRRTTVVAEEEMEAEERVEEREVETEEEVKAEEEVEEEWEEEPEEPQRIRIRETER
jgi:hypothetical protein